MTENEVRAYAIALDKKAKYFDTQYPLVSSLSAHLRLPKDVQDFWVASGKHSVPVGDFDVHCELSARYWSHNYMGDSSITLRVRFVTTKYGVEVCNDSDNSRDDGYKNVMGRAIESLGELVEQVVMDLETKLAQEQIHLSSLPYVVR